MEEMCCFLPVPSDNGERCLRTELEQHYYNCLHRGDRNESAWTKTGISVSEAPRTRSIRCRPNSHGTLAAAYKPYASAEQTWRRCAVFYLSRATTASAVCGLSSSSIVATACTAGTEMNQRWTKTGISGS